MSSPNPVDPVPIRASRTKKRWLGRLSVGHVAALTAGSLAFIVNFLLLQASDQRIPVAVAGEDLVIGQGVEVEMLVATDVQVDASISQQLLRHDHLAGYGPLVAYRSISAGEILTTAAVGPPAAPDNRRAMSIPVETSHAVGGALQRGDLVDVIVVRGEQAAFAATGLEVLEVPAGESGALSGSRSFYVTVAVDQHQALVVAAALRQGDFEIVRATGAEHVSISSIGPALGEEER